MTNFNEDNIRRDSAGKFSEKGHSSPEISLSMKSIEPTPADVLTPEFTLDTLRAHFGTDPENIELDDAGNTCADFWREGYGGSRHGTRVVIDEQGEVLRVDEQWSGEWGNTDHLMFDRERHALRGKVNRDRLAFAGILTQNEGAGTGVYGHRYLGGRASENVHDAADVAKRIRQDIKRAQEFGAIPASLSYTVRTSKFAGGQSIRIAAEGVRDEQQYAEREPGFKHGRHPWASELDHTLGLIGNQWQDDQSDSQQDYFHVNYYLQVEFPDEHMQRWQADEREKAAAKRRPRKNTGAS